MDSSSLSPLRRSRSQSPTSSTHDHPFRRQVAIGRRLEGQTGVGYQEDDDGDDDDCQASLRRSRSLSPVAETPYTCPHPSSPTASSHHSPSHPSLSAHLSTSSHYSTPDGKSFAALSKRVLSSVNPMSFRGEGKNGNIEKTSLVFLHTGR